MISPFNKHCEGKILGAMEYLTGGADVAGGGGGLKRRRYLELRRDVSGVGLQCSCQRG